MSAAKARDTRDDSARAQQMEAVVAEHETALLRYVTRILNDPFSAQDVVQRVFVKLFKQWQAGTRPTDKLKGWLYRVAHNEAIDHIRHESRAWQLHKRHVEEKEVQACPDGVHCAMTDAERRGLVLEQVRGLQPREQQVLLLRLEEGLSYREISEVTGRSEGNIGNILHHAVRKLSASLKKAGCA